MLLGDAVEDRRLDHRRCDAVHEDARAREVLPDRLRHRDDRGLRRGIGTGHRVALLPRDRCDVDDAPVPALDHVGDDGAVGEEDAVGVDPHHPAPLLVGDVNGRERRARHAGRADEDVDRPQLTPDLRDRRVDVGRAGDVPAQREHVLRRLRMEVERGDARALVAKSAGGRLADAARPARDERHPPRESLRVAHRSQASLEFRRMTFDPRSDYPVRRRGVPTSCRLPAASRSAT